MNNTDDISFWDYPLPFQLFVGFILICTAIAALIDCFITDIIHLLIGYRINLYIAHFACTIIFIILFIIMLIGIMLAAILNVVFTRFL